MGERGPYAFDRVDTVARAAGASCACDWTGSNAGCAKSTLNPVSGEEEIALALKRKRSREQFTGDNPWVVVLDHTSAPFMGAEQLRAGAAKHYANSTRVSAVVVQCRRYSSPGFALGPDAAFTVDFRTWTIVNPRARLPLPAAALALLPPGTPPDL